MSMVDVKMVQVLLAIRDHPDYVIGKENSPTLYTIPTGHIKG